MDMNMEARLLPSPEGDGPRRVHCMAMPNFHRRLLRFADSIYLQAAGAFQAGRFREAEVKAAASMTMAGFLMQDPETPDNYQTLRTNYRIELRGFDGSG
jgi:hypothetical protein